MEITNFSTFVAIAETTSFSEAAQRLHLTQPAVSKRLAVLEQQLNVRLFDRIGRLVTLTEAGKALLPRAYQILSTVDDTHRALSNLRENIGGKLTLATSHHVGLHRLPTLLRRFNRTYPQVTLDIRFLDSELAYDQVLHGHVELAVITLAPNTEAPVRAIPTWDDPLVFVVAPEHPLAFHDKPLTLQDIVNHPAIFPGDNTFTHHIVSELFHQARLTPRISMSTNYLETIKMMVSIGLAWSVLPRTMLDDQLVELVIPGLLLERQLGYIYHTERTLSNAARTLMQFINAEQQPPLKKRV